MCFLLTMIFCRQMNCNFAMFKVLNYRKMQRFLTSFWQQHEGNCIQYFTASSLPLLTTVRKLRSHPHFESLKYNQFSIISNGLSSFWLFHVSLKKKKKKLKSLWSAISTAAKSSNHLYKKYQFLCVPITQKEYKVIFMS